MPLSKFFGAVRGVGVFCLAWRTFVLPSKIVEHVNGFVAFPVNQLAFHVACQAPRSRAIPALVRSYVGKDTETPSSSPDLSARRCKNAVRKAEAVSKKTVPSGVVSDHLSPYFLERSPEI